MRKRCRECVDRFSGALRSRSRRIVAELRQPQKIQRGHRASRWLRSVVVVLHPEEHTLVLSARAEIAAVLLVEKQAVLRLLQFDRKLQPIDIERGLVKIEKALDHECVVISKTFDIAATSPIIAIEQFALFFMKIS